MNGTDWFETTFLDDMVVIYKALISEGESSIKELHHYARQIYEQFFSILNDSIHDKFRNIFKEMNLETTWSFSYCLDLASRSSSIAVVYDMNENGKSDYSPLIKFIIPLDADRLNSSYLSAVSKEISEKLTECLEEAFKKWRTAWGDYYRDLSFEEFLSGNNPSTPADDPEIYFLTHELVILS